MKKLIDEINYRYENPTVQLSIDEKIVIKFLEKYRERHVIEQFALWASMSNENADHKLENMINNREPELETSKQNSK